MEGGMERFMRFEAICPGEGLLRDRARERRTRRIAKRSLSTGCIAYFIAECSMQTSPK